MKLWEIDQDGGGLYTLQLTYDFPTPQRLREAGSTKSHWPERRMTLLRKTGVETVRQVFVGGGGVFHAPFPLTEPNDFAVKKNSFWIINQYNKSGSDQIPWVIIHAHKCLNHSFLPAGPDGVRWDEKEKGVLEHFQMCP